MSNRLHANDFLNRAIAELELARRSRGVANSDSVVECLGHSREAAANAYVAVIVLHGGKASIADRLRDLVEHAATFAVLDPCAADAWEIEGHITNPSYEHATADAHLLARAAVNWARDVFGESAEA